MGFPQYPKPTDTLEGFTNTGQTYWGLEIWKNEAKMALVKVLWEERKIHLLDDLPTSHAKMNNNIPSVADNMDRSISRNNLTDGVNE